ncbi:hypothetical protein FRC01_014423, partial [Tulasnella sp. 417]
KCRVPIEIFNPHITVNPIETWKDIGRVSDFTYRPGVEDKVATFKPKSVQNYFRGFFDSIWDCEAITGGSGDQQVARQIVVKEMKFVRKNSITDLDMNSIRKHAQRQFRVWMKLDHQNVASIIGEILHPEICVMTLRYEHNDIMEYIQTPGMTGSDRKARTETRSRLLNLLSKIKEVTSGLEYLHSQKVIHGEVHSSNVSVDSDGHVKIANFGLAGILAQANTQRSWIETPSQYFPPEYILHGTPPSLASDVYSYGLLLLEASSSSIRPAPPL